MNRLNEQIKNVAHAAKRRRTDRTTYWSILLTAVVSIIFSTEVAFAQEFILIPDPPDIQAAMDIVLACQNGVAFGFNTMNRQAMLDNNPMAWDVSFATGDGNLLIKEYPLWLGLAATPLVQEGRTFGYSKFSTLLWREAVPPGPLAMCISGAGSGFCEVTVMIENCQIATTLVADITQIGEQDTTPIVTDELVYEVRAYDPEVGTQNGDGIALVEMKIVNIATGTEVFARTLPATATATGITFCAFSENCTPWIFADHEYTWPNGARILNGSYLLRTILHTPQAGRMVVQKQIEIKGAPSTLLNPADGATYLFIPGGTFVMGAAEGPGVSPLEQPSHEVAVADFWLQQTETTNIQYARCVQIGVCTAPANDRWQQTAFADHPVTNIDWQQANTYAHWVGGRLPTEAEWEKACRGVDARTFPWGNDAPTDQLANYNQNVGDTMPVGSYPAGAGPHGLLDMGGNVWEWTSSLHRQYPYVANDGREDLNSADERTWRGGSFFYTQYQIACTARASYPAASSTEQIGLRVLLSMVSIVEPQNAATVPPIFNVSMAAAGLTIEPSGELHPNAGHFHILVDADFVEPGVIVPFDDNHHHFREGERAAPLTLSPGVHTLRLQFADNAHIALAGAQYRDEITVTVE